MTKESIDKIARKLAESMPSGLKFIKEDIENNFKSIIENNLKKLDLVTREEFDVQKKVLERTLAKLEELESKIIDNED